MEVCGTHTVSIYKFGIPSILPASIKLISGPGCPVCVTEQDYIDKAIAYLKKGYKIFTFGDMVRVPGGRSSLEKETSNALKIIYSPLDALQYAKGNKKDKIILLAVGFETTAPLIAAVVEEAYHQKLSNFFIFSALKLIPPAIRNLLDSKEIKIDGFILPGHVSTIIGAHEFKEIAQNYNIPSVISGFEAEDIIESIYFLVSMLRDKKEFFKIQYRRVVKEEGNVLAKRKIQAIFDVVETKWRGLGRIDNSGLRLKPKYKMFDIEVMDDIRVGPVNIDSRCKCGDVIKGLLLPFECPLFGEICTPENPYGPCMVSSEGSCSAYYKYGR